jgi:hypothetical protein
MDEIKKIGVDLIKKSIKFLFDFAGESIEAFKDKKLQLSEILGFGDNVYSGITIALKSDELWLQLKDLDTAEGVEIAEYVGSLVKGATSEEIGLIIDNSIAAIRGEIEIYETNIMPIIETIKKLKG